MTHDPPAPPAERGDPPPPDPRPSTATPTTPGRSAAPVDRRLRPRTPAAWVTVVGGATFLVLWAVFAVRAVDRNADPTPGLAPPDLRATYDAANSAIPPGTDRPYLPDGADATPLASPGATPATPSTSPVTTPDATPVASPPPTR